VCILVLSECKKRFDWHATAVHIWEDVLVHRLLVPKNDPIVLPNSRGNMILNMNTQFQAVFYNAIIMS